MSTQLSPCSACGLPNRGEWILLATHCQFSVPLSTYICPRCTMAHTGPQRRNVPLSDQYMAKNHRDYADYARPEDESGQLYAASNTLAVNARRARRQQIEELIALQQQTREGAEQPRPTRVLHIGAQQGELLAALDPGLNVQACALELDPKLRAAAKRRGLEVQNEPIESRSKTEGSQPGFDLIFEHYLLQHLQQPRAHLKAIARQLSDRGLAVIEVPNLCQAPGSLEEDFLCLKQPSAFTPHALATMASHAGLAPVSMIADENLTIVLRKITSAERKTLARKVFPGPDATTVAKAARANDLRLTVKRGLYRIGVRAEMMQLAEQAYDKCVWAPGKADIAIEIAAALDRVGQREQSIAWLQKSLDHRADTEIQRLIRDLQNAQKHAPRVEFFDARATQDSESNTPKRPAKLLSERWSLQRARVRSAPN